MGGAAGMDGVWRLSRKQVDNWKNKNTFLYIGHISWMRC